MKVLKLMIVMFILIMSVGAVCAAENITDDTIGDDSKEILETVQKDITTNDNILKTTQNDIYTSSDDSFTNLTDEIQSKDTVDLTHDYKFNNESDNSKGIIIAKDNFVLNGNGCTIDGNNQSRLFYITGTNITINDLILINGNYENCAGLCVIGSALTLNNVTFIDNHGNKEGGAIGIRDGATLICNNSRFIDNYAETGASILAIDSELKLYNSNITSKNFAKGSHVFLTSSEKDILTRMYIENITFVNINTSYAPAVYLKVSNGSIVNSKFINLTANITAGAIATKTGGNLYIENCEFENVTSSKNGGAIFADVIGDEDFTGSVTIVDTKFKDTYSGFGGAYVQLGGNTVLKNTEFINSHATYNGGAIYLSYTNPEINNCTFDSNGVSIIEEYPTYGGAIFCDKSTLNITESKFFNNKASAGSGIYAYDTSYNIKNSIFENNTNPIYTVFDKESVLENNVYNNDNNISQNNTYYATTMIGKGMQLVLLNNTINISTIPSSFDLRDYGWVSSVKDQAWMGACWTFGMTGTLESALLKAANITTDFSENNMQNSMLKYSIYGHTKLNEGGANILSTAYLLSWLGAFTQDSDTYDEVGKLSPVITTLNDIHVQDVMFTPNNEIPNGTRLKLAIMKYGALDVGFFGQSTFNDVNPYYNPETCAHYVNESLAPTHDVSIIGWDDNYDANNFLITPPGNGAWIVKNSYGTEWGDNGFFYISYYDKTLINNSDVTNYATSIIIENTEPYNKNYQYNLVWGGDFKSGNQKVSYMNEFEAIDDDRIAAVGTYFDKEDIDYTVKIYVNDELKLTQEGVSPYFGYHTIKLNKYIPIRKGDVFKVLITSNAAPSLNLTEARSHYTQNISYISFDGETWEDTYDLGYIVCLKAYTVEKATFSKLQEAIVNSTENHLDLYRDYEFDNETDNSTGILIDMDNFVINGNGHMINATNLSRIFNITANNVTLSNLILTGGNADKGGAIYTTGLLTLNNVTFIDNYASKQGAAVGLYENVTIKCDNSRFIDNYAVEKGSAIYLDKGELELSNTNMTSKWVSKSAQITAYKNATIHIENAIFANTTSTYSPALYIQRSNVSIINSKFNNLKADITAGAISLKECDEVYIENCEFTNVTSSKNGGTINADIWGDANVNGNVTIIDTIFNDTCSEFGGAYLQLGGSLFINNTVFTNNHATYNGGSLYLSYVTSNITNCNFTSNGVDVIEGYPTYGGAIFNDMGTLNVDKSNFINNTASAGNAIGAYDSSYNIKNSLFENNTNPIYTFFDKEGVLDNNTYINDANISTNNELHTTIVLGQGLQLTLLNNTINVTTLPARFDLRDYGWVSPVKDQGWMGACWTFGMTGALESVILKAANITSDFSENNMKDSMYRYSIYGDSELVEGGNNVYSLSYLVSWLGALIYDADVYDEMGKISPVITTLNDVHVQDAIFVPNNEIPNGTKLKEAIIKYGSLAVSYCGQSTYDEENPYYNEDTYAQYVDKPLNPNHAVSIVGWDDNFPKENFLITPPGDGAWIVKNSWGSGWGDNGYLYVSYYDQTLLRYDPAQPSSCAATVIFENTVPYNKNYQYAIIGGGNFMSGENNVSYMNVFEALDDDLIAGVGTYFNQEGVNYTIEIYVNDELKLTQEGVSPFFGYHTIKLNDYIPIKKGDEFKAIITSNAMPFITQADVRVHYTENISFFSIDGAPWADSYKDGKAIVCLKVYTVADDSKIINNKDMTVDYDSGSYFTVQVVTADGHSIGAGAVVNFTINGKTTTTKTDENGTAKIEITEVPGTYEITTTYNNQTYTNSISVKLNPDTCKVIDNKDMTVNYNDESYFTVKVVSEDEKVNAIDAPVTFIINGKTTTTFTDEDGIAKIKITENPGTYTIKTTFNNNTYTNTITVTSNDNNTPDKKHKHDNIPNQHNSRPTYSKQATYNPQPTYTLYRASDMKIICHSNIINLKALMDLFDLNLTNGHLKVYIDGTLIFDGDVGDDLTKTIFEIIEKFLGKHEITIEFTDNNGNTQKHNETIIIK